METSSSDVDFKLINTIRSLLWSEMLFMTWTNDFIKAQALNILDIKSQLFHKENEHNLTRNTQIYHLSINTWELNILGI